MALQNVIPLSPGFSWASSTPAATQEMITTYNAEELEALSHVPEAAIAWANQGTNVALGQGIVKYPWRIPGSLAYQPFEYGGTRQYQSIDLAAPQVKVAPFSLNFGWPMVWDTVGNGWKLMEERGVDASGRPNLEEFIGIGGLASACIDGARAYKAQLVANIFYLGYTSAALGLAAQVVTVPQPGSPNGVSFFSNGVDTPLHYAHPFNKNSGRFQNAWPAFGSFAQNYGRSLVKLAQVPHPTLPNMTFGIETTDVVGPTWMRDRFWAMAVQSLALQTTTVSNSGVGAATTSPFALDTMGKWNASNFLGASGFAPTRFWIAPQLDNHPYFTANNNANMTSGPNGGPADMWINISAVPGKGHWAVLAGNSKECTPFARLYGPGDPRAMSERRVRLETDLDLGVQGNVYHLAHMFFGV